MKMKKNDLLNVHPNYIKTNGDCKRNYNVLHVTLGHPKSMVRRKTTFSAFAGTVCNYGFLVYSFESSFFHSLNYEDFACSFQF